MLTQSVVDTLASLAGPDFTWAGVRSCSRPPSSYMGRPGIRQAFRLDMLARQEGLCFWCGGIAEVPEFCHIVSRGPKCRGWLPGAVAVGCAACNDCRDSDGNRQCDPDRVCQYHYGPVLPVAAMARPDVVPMEWTPWKNLTV